MLPKIQGDVTASVDRKSIVQLGVLGLVLIVGFFVAKAVIR